MTLPKSKDGLITYLKWCERNIHQKDEEINALDYEIAKLKERNRVLTEELIKCGTKH